MNNTNQEFASLTRPGLVVCWQKAGRQGRRTGFGSQLEAVFPPWAAHPAGSQSRCWTEYFAVFSWCSLTLDSLRTSKYFSCTASASKERPSKFKPVLGCTSKADWKCIFRKKKSIGLNSHCQSDILSEQSANLFPISDLLKLHNSHTKLRPSPVGSSRHWTGMLVYFGGCTITWRHAVEVAADQVKAKTKISLYVSRHVLGFG